MNDTHKAQPFDEQAALAELERLADKIQATRRQRAHTVAEFETFVKTFRQDRYQELISQHEAELQHEVRAQARPVRPIGEVAANLGIRAPEPPAAAATPVVSAPPAAAASTPGAASSPAPEPVAATYKPTAIAVALSPPAVAPTEVDHPAPGIGAFKPEPLPPPVVAPVSASASSADRAAGASPRSRLPLAAAAAAVVVIAAGFWMFGGSSEAPDAAATSAAATAAAPAPEAAAPAAAPSSPPPKPVPTRALNIELVTVKPVWLRVTVDGTRAIESELPADRRLPFAADKLIQIRAGNGGAVKLMVAGEDRGLLGADGRVVDRQLTPAPR